MGINVRLLFLTEEHMEQAILQLRVRDAQKERDTKGRYVLRFAYENYFKIVIWADTWVRDERLYRAMIKSEPFEKDLDGLPIEKRDRLFEHYFGEEDGK